MKNKILKEVFNLVLCINFGLTVGMFYTTWIMKWGEVRDMEIVLSLAVLAIGIAIGYSIGTKERLNLITDKEKYKESNKDLRQEAEDKELIIYRLKNEILEVKKSLLQVLKEAHDTLNQNNYDRLDLIRSNTSEYLKEQIDILDKDIKIELSDDANQQ